MTLEREQLVYDVVIVGGGPAGLSAGIRLKQLAHKYGKKITVCLIDKGREIGAHILSGAILDPEALSTFLPDWRALAPSATPVREDRFFYLTQKHALPLPAALQPRLMHNRGCFIISLGELCRGLAVRAEELGVEIYPGFAAAQVLYGERGEVTGILTGDMGRNRDGIPKENFTAGMELRARYLLLAEGAHGFLSEQIITHFGLRETCDVQKYGLGLKELWLLPTHNHRPGLTLHALGWPLDKQNGGGVFLYHWGENLCSFGLVQHLDYSDPYISPFDCLQRAKTHPVLRPFFKDAKRIGYGARVVSEGGWQSVPRLTFPGGALIGCAAGFMNVPRIKGIHNAISSASSAAEAVYDAVQNGRSGDMLLRYQNALPDSVIARDLKPVRNVKPLWSRFGTVFGGALGGADMWCQQLIGISPFGTLSHKGPDHALNTASGHLPTRAMKPDGVLTFDKMSSVYQANVRHRDDQPVHLHLADSSVPLRVNKPQYDEPAERYCPAGVYEIIDTPDGKKFQINAANCLHCKACEIKDPSQNLHWTPPEGGSGPDYSYM